jgi:hypothetical protein
MYALLQTLGKGLQSVLGHSKVVSLYLETEKDIERLCKLVC